MALKDVSCPHGGCEGEAQFTIDPDEHITDVKESTAWGHSYYEKCPSCGSKIYIDTESI